MKKTPRFLLCASLWLCACQPIVASRGNILEPDALAQIKAGETTREDVATKLGTPTEVSTFDEKIWYYVGRKTEQYSFLDPSIIKQEAVEIDFDDAGLVTSIHSLDVSKAADISPVERETPTFGNDHTFIRQLLGDLSHPLPDIGNKGHIGQ